MGSPRWQCRSITPDRQEKAVINRRLDKIQAAAFPENQDRKKPDTGTNLVTFVTFPGWRRTSASSQVGSWPLNHTLSLVPL